MAPKRRDGLPACSSYCGILADPLPSHGVSVLHCYWCGAFSIAVQEGIYNRTRWPIDDQCGTNVGQSADGEEGEWTSPQTSRRCCAGAFAAPVELRLNSRS